MSYRDDLGATHARLEAVEREKAALEVRIAEGTAANDLVPRPITVTVEGTADGTRLSVADRRNDTVSTIVFASLLLAIAGYALATGQSMVSIVFTSLFAVGLLFGVAKTRVNRTVFDVSLARLRVEHGPLSLRGGETFIGTRVRQFFVKRDLGTRGVPTTWKLCAIVDNDEHRTIADNLSHEEAVFLEKTIESRMGIFDRVVVGEDRLG